MKVICFECSNCGALATKDLRWIKPTEVSVDEHLLCKCGSTAWKFVHREPSEITEDTLVKT